MGKPAARLLDTVAHKPPGVLGPGPGSPNVIIGGKAAWRGLPAGASLPEPPPEPEPEEDQTEEEAGAAQQAAAEEAMLAAGGGADIHACAQIASPVTVDGPGFVTTGSATVMINGLPACRAGDTIIEILAPTPNVIEMGCPTVLIGG